MKLFKPILILIFILNSCNLDKKKVNTTNLTTQKALILVFNSDNDNQVDFWQAYKNSVFKFTKSLYKSGSITYVMPFSHKALKHPDNDKSWTDAVIIGLSSDEEDNESTVKEIIEYIQNSKIAPAFKSADIMQLQKGLDMFYAVKNGIKEENKLEQIVEYVFSDPKARKRYYEEQSLFSGPAMAELHSNDMAGRFIGFELEKRVFGDNFPQWDVIHVVGFTKEHTKKATPVFYPIWDKHAKKVFGKEMTFLKKKSQWDTLRLNIKSNAKQQMNVSFTLNKKEN